MVLQLVGRQSEANELLAWRQDWRDLSHLAFDAQQTTTLGVLDRVLTVQVDQALVGFTLQVQAMHGNSQGPRLGKAIGERILR